MENIIKGDFKMTKGQEVFWEKIKRLQDEILCIYSLKLSRYDTKEDLLKDVTYDTIYSLMELLDGFRNENIRGNVIFLSSGKSINSEHDPLHNYCENYLSISKL